MGREVRNAGKALVTAGIAGLSGYLIAAVVAGGRHPVWPYLLFGGVSVAGIIIFLAVRGEHADNTDQRLAELGAALRLAAARRGFPEGTIPSRLHGTWSAADIEQFLAGTRWPQWAFVQAFAQLITGNKSRRSAYLERQIFPHWVAAAPQGAPASPPGRRRTVRRVTGAAAVTGGAAAAAALAAAGVILGVVVPSSPSAAGSPACTDAATPDTASAGIQLNQPDAIAVDGGHVWVANFGSSTVTEFSASDGHLIRVLSQPGYGFDHPRAIGVAGSHVWVANAYSSTVTELNAGDGTLVKVIGGFAGPNGIATTSTSVWVTSDGGNGGASVAELNAKDGTRVLPLIAGRFSQPDAIAVDGGHVWVANFGSSTVTELSASNGHIVRVLSGQMPPATMTAPADGTEFATPQVIRAAGTVQPLQPGHHIAIFLEWQATDGSWQPRYWVGDAALGSNGSWTGSACLGFALTDVGNVKIWLVDLGPRGYSAVIHASYDELHHGFPESPDSLATDDRMLIYNIITTGSGGPGC
jgi:hypothetical protein